MSDHEKVTVIHAKTYNSICFLDYYVEKTIEDPFFIDNGFKVYKFEPHPLCYTEKTLQKPVIPVKQRLKPVFSKKDAKIFGVTRKGTTQLVLRYDTSKTKKRCKCKNCRSSKKVPQKVRKT